MDTDADGATHVQPSAGSRGSVYIPPTIARFNAAMRRAWHRVERPRLVRMPAVHRAQCRTLHLSQKATLMMMMRISGRLCARRPGKIEFATVLRRGRGARRYRRPGVTAGCAAGAARRRRSLAHPSRCASTATAAPSASSPASVLRRTATALWALLPGMETLTHRRVRQRRRALAAQFVALRRQHGQRRASQSRMILQHHHKIYAYFSIYSVVHKSKD